MSGHTRANPRAMRTPQNSVLKKYAISAPRKPSFSTVLREMLKWCAQLALD